MIRQTPHDNRITYAAAEIIQQPTLYVSAAPVSDTGGGDDHTVMSKGLYSDVVTYQSINQSIIVYPQQ